MVFFWSIFRCLELEILSSTYSGSTLSALKKIRTHLDESIADIRTGIQRIRANLGQYESVGSEFEIVVKEFAKLRADIAGKRWALKELKKDDDENC